MKKKIFSFLMTLILLVGVGFTQKVYAAYWEQQGYDWKYLDNNNSYTHGWKLVDNKLYYFDTTTNLMKIGWFYDYSTEKWYYATLNGDVPTLKSGTATLPTELCNAQNKIKQYITNDIIYTLSSNIKGDLFVWFKENNNSYTRYFYRQSTGNVYKIENGILTDLETNTIISSFTQEQAVELVKEYLSSNNKYIPNIIELDHDDGESYVIHCYDNIEGHNATGGWYYVNKSTRDVKSMF